jgi:hypothetical protein
MARINNLWKASKNGLLALDDALASRTENEYTDLSDPYTPKPPKCWPSTIDYIDHNCGGFYGMTVVAAEPGTGKTFLGIANAIEAAATQQWQVVMFAAEDDYDGFRDRFNRYLNANPASKTCIPYLHFHSVGKGQTPRSLTDTVMHAVDINADIPILIVMDSINSIVNLGGGNYLKSLSDFGLWAALSRRISEGDVSFFITSETNKSGEAKGEALPYWADVYLQMKKVKGSDFIVDMTLAKTRRTPGEGPMGKYLRRWDTGRYEPDIYNAPLKIVNGERYE